MKLNAAVVGCGLVGSQYDTGIPKEFALSHSGAYYLNKNINLVALCDLDKARLKKAQAKWRVKSGYTNFQELLAKEKIDILSICSSTHSHLEILQSALGVGAKAIFLEKPIAYNFSEADKLSVKVNNSKARVAVNYWRRWDPTMIELKQLFDKGFLGRVTKVNVFYTKGIIDIGSHAVDLIRWFFGEPYSVVALSTNINNRLVDAPIDACFKMKAGFNFYLQGFDRKNFNIFEIDIVSEKGRVRILKGAREIQFYQVKPDPVYRHLNLLNKTPQLIRNRWRYMLMNPVEDLINATRTGNNPRCNYQDGLRALELSSLALKSAKNDGREIRIN